MSKTALKEWALGKSSTIVEKLFAIISRKTGIPFKVCSYPEIYKNEWGSFIGYYIGSERSSQKYRVNFKVGSTENFASIDRYYDADDQTPDFTLSLEGFGIGAVFNQIVDFMTGKLNLAVERDKSLTESTIHEAVAGLVRMSELDKISKALEKRPEFIVEYKNTPDAKKEILVLKWVQQVMEEDWKSKKKFVAKKAMELFSKALAGANATVAKAAPVPVTKVVPAAKTQTNLITDPTIAADLQELSSSGAAETYEQYREAIQLMLTDSLSTRAVFAYGLPGTGKSFHARQVLELNGLTNGSSYYVAKGKIKGVTGLIQLLWQCKDYEVLVFDDCDSMWTASGETGEAMQNILKALLDMDTAPVVGLNVATKDPGATKGQEGDDGQAGIIPPTFMVNAKLIFITNLPKDKLPDALDSRIGPENIIEFDFTDEELLDLIRKALGSMLSQFPEITLEMKEEVYQHVERVRAAQIQQTGESHTTLSFRLFETGIRYRMLYPTSWTKRVTKAVSSPAWLKANGYKG